MGAFVLMAVISALAVALPSGAIVLGRLRRTSTIGGQAWRRVLAFGFFWGAFNLSFLAMWGATIARHLPSEAFVAALAVALPALQIAAALVCFRLVVRDVPRHGAGPSATSSEPRPKPE